MKFAFRSLLKSPGYTLVALITLALGIGVNTSMFSVVDTLLFRSAPYPNPDNLVMLSAQTRGGSNRFFSDQEIREIRPQADGFSSLTTLGYTDYAMAEPGRTPERIRGLSFSSDMMATLQIQPMIGRAFTADEFAPGKNHVVLLNEAFWISRFGGRRDVVGRTIRLNGESVTIIGVMPARFDYKMLWGNAALIRPLNFTSDQVAYRGYRAFNLLGRLKPGVTSDTIKAQLASVAADQEKAFPQDYAGLSYRTMPLNEVVMDSVGRAISWMLLGLSGFVLLIACANLANLQLARATASAREFAIRAALGASRLRLVVQQLNECVLLAVVGGGLGFLVALFVNELLERSILIDGVPGLKIVMDGFILCLTLLVSLLTGAAFGIVPALFASRNDVNSTLKSQSRGSTAGRGHNVMRQVLIVAEVALALVLLGCAAIMNRGFDQLLRRSVGWDTTKVLTAQLALSENRYDNDKRLAFYRAVETKLKSLPGVQDVSLSNSLPLFNYPSDQPIFVDAPSAGAAGNKIIASHLLITPGYFATLGIPVREGRTFAEDAKADGPQQILINENLARQFWPNESAVGKRLGVTENNQVVWREIIGVVGNVDMAANIANPATTLHVYRRLTQEPWSVFNVALRSDQPATLADAARRAVAELDPDLALDRVTTVEQFINGTQHNLIVIGHTLTAFAALGLVLAAVGLYGVISHLVAQRTSEFGIRIALGAQPGNVLADVLGRGLRLAALGLTIGLVGAWAMGRFLAAVMPRLAASDPVGIATMAAILFLVTLVACWIPARRATKVDPLTALRAE